MDYGLLLSKNPKYQDVGPDFPAFQSPLSIYPSGPEMKQIIFRANLSYAGFLQSRLHPHMLWSRSRTNRLWDLLRLSKKSKWPIPIIFAPLKINNLQATENRKMPRFRVFRQARYISSVFPITENVSICFLYVESGGIISFGNLRSLKHPLTEHSCNGRKWQSFKNIHVFIKISAFRCSIETAH